MGGTKIKIQKRKMESGWINTVIKIFSQYDGTSRMPLTPTKATPPLLVLTPVDPCNFLYFFSTPTHYNRWVVRVSNKCRLIIITIKHYVDCWLEYSSPLSSPKFAAVAWESSLSETVAVIDVVVEMSDGFVQPCGCRAPPRSTGMGMLPPLLLLWSGIIADDDAPVIVAVAVAPKLFLAFSSFSLWFIIIVWRNYLHCWLPNYFTLDFCSLKDVEGMKKQKQKIYCSILSIRRH